MTKGELKQYRRLGEEIEDLQERIAAIRSAGLKSPRIDGMPKASGGSGDPIGAVVARIDALEAQLTAVTAQRNLIEAAIASVSDSAQRTCLRYRYIDDLTWEEIAARMNYSDRHVIRIHGDALQEISKI